MLTTGKRELRCYIAAGTAFPGLNIRLLRQAKEDLEQVEPGSVR